MDTPESTLDQSLALYQQGEICDLELQAIALENVPIENPKEFLQRLPDDIHASLRAFVFEAADWSEEEWEIPYVLGELEPCAETIKRDRLRCLALRRYFVESDAP